MISETKVGQSFSIGIFLTDNSFNTPNCSDCDCKGGRIMLFVRGGIPSNLLATEIKPL